MRMEDVVAKYVALRDRKKETKDRHAAELKPFDDALEALEGIMGKHLNEVGADSVKTPEGTFYRQTRVNARVADWSKVLDFAVENGRYDLFERRVNKAVVEEIGAVPGVEVDTTVVVNVRRS